MSSQAQCSKCTAPNEYSSIVCDMCGARLPWADAVSASATRATKENEQRQAAQAPPHNQVKTWFYTHNSQRHGPVSESQMSLLFSNGSLGRDAMVWQEGMQDWQAAHLSPLSKVLRNATGSTPPPIAPEEIDNSIVWFLAFAPFLGLLLQGLAAGLGGTSFNSLWYVPVLLNIVLCLADQARLTNAGYDTKGMGLLAFLLVPAYLFVRASRLKQSNAYAIVWLVVFFLTFAAPAMMLTQ